MKRIGHIPVAIDSFFWMELLFLRLNYLEIFLDKKVCFFFFILMGPKLYIEWACARLMDPTPLKSSAILDSNPSKAQFSVVYVEFVKRLRR